MDAPACNTLLALLLALMAAEGNISPDEQSTLTKVGQQLYLYTDDPNKWASIEAKIMKIIGGNASLKSVYQPTKDRLEALNGDILLGLLPTEDKLQELIPANRNFQIKGDLDQNKHRGNTNRIGNMAIVVLTAEDKSETAKTLLQQFWESLQSTII